jgi:hypothetical protein
MDNPSSTINESDIASITGGIRQLLLSSTNGTMLGSKLGSELPKICIYNKIQHGKLSEFIQKHFADSVVVVSKNGVDPIYALKGTQVPQLSQWPEIPVDETALRVFRSPNAPHKLYAHHGSNEIRAFLPKEPVPEVGWTYIPACTSEEHIAIAKKWISQLTSESHRQALGALAMRGTSLNSEFYKKVIELDLASQWQKFRMPEFRRLLQSRISAVNRSGASEYFVDPSIAAPRNLPARPDRPVSQSRGLDVRDLVLAAVQRMTDAELRAIPVPVGLVIDILRGN